MQGSKRTWYQEEKEHVLSTQKTDHRAGLSAGEVERRRARFGVNLIAEAKGKTALSIFLSQFADFLILILAGAAVVAALLGEPQDIAAILAIIVLNGVLGFIQEFRAERALQALKQLAAPFAKVRREGKALNIPAFELVPGDIVLLEAGNIVPADLRLIEVKNLRTDEATLTGESVPTDKSPDPILAEHLYLAEQRNMAFKGTLVVAGRGTGVVVSTGMSTELGRIAGLLREEVEVRTPLQKKLADFARKLAYAILLICMFVFFTGLLRGEDTALMLLTAVSLAVAAIPEALPAVVTVALAIGARTMSKRNALVRKLPAIESLGSVTCICSDKTGTLTENRMNVEAFRLMSGFSKGVMQPDLTPLENECWALLMQAMALNNDASMNVKGAAEGEPTEAALLAAAEQRGFHKETLDRTFPRTDEVPFTSERGLMSTAHLTSDDVLIFSKGAPEKLLPLCSQMIGPKGTLRELQLTEELTAAREMAASGMRVLAFGFKRMKTKAVSLDHREMERDLTFLGMAGLLDPPRAGASSALSACRGAGIHVIMITGDHPATALSMAKRLGLNADERSGLMSGAELEATSDQEFSLRLKEITVFARIAPENKIRIVKALQASGEIVAMTGDGVNDAPALKRADVGVAMGKGGTDVAREAAHILLLDDHFASIVSAVGEGRRIYDNIRKFVRFALSGNSGEMWTLFLAPFLGLPLPLLPIQILWVNLVTDGLPGLALAFEPAEGNLMTRPPRPPRESIFARGLWQHVLWVGLLTGGVTLATQALAIKFGSAHWQSMAFTVLTFTQMGHVLAIRSERDSLFFIGLRTNRPLLAAILLTLGLQFLILYLPALNAIFKTTPLTIHELLACLIISTSVFLAVEFEKWIRRRI